MNESQVFSLISVNYIVIQNYFFSYWHLFVELHRERFNGGDGWV